MKFRLSGTQIRIDLLLILLLPLAMITDAGRYAGLLMLSLAAHEGAHILAAKALRIRISELHLSPIGASARIENPYALAPCRIIATAAAGPAASLLLVLASASLCQWGFASPILVEFMHINALLLFFNLLPALPLDGGRMVCTLLSRLMGTRKALTICITFGFILACILVTVAFHHRHVYGTLPLPLLMSAVFLIASAADERSSVSQRKALSLLEDIRPLTKPEKTSLIAVDASTPPLTALQESSPGKRTLFAVYENGRFHHITDAADFLDTTLQKAEPLR